MNLTEIKEKYKKIEEEIKVLMVYAENNKINRKEYEWLLKRLQFLYKEFINYGMDILKENDKKAQKEKILLLIAIILSLGVIPLFILKFPIFLLFDFIVLYSNYLNFKHIDTRKDEYSKYVTKNDLDIIVLVNIVKDVFERSYTRNVPLNMEEAILDKKIDLVNDILQVYIQTGKMIYLPLDMQDILIKMLQDDLKTDEKDLNVLLDIARDKVMTGTKDTKDNSYYLERNC